jgi:putative oxidoreductase
MQRGAPSSSRRSLTLPLRFAGIQLFQFGIERSKTAGLCGAIFEIFRSPTMLKRILGTSDDYTLTVLRLVLGIIFFAHGAQKMLGWFGGFGFHATMGAFTGMMHIPAPLAFLAITAEFCGGIGLILGLLTRIAALGIATNMLVAIFTVHLQFGLFANWYGNQKGEGIEYHLLVIAITIVLMARGAGALSADRALSK